VVRSLQEIRRAEIIDAALAELATRGVGAVRMEDVSRNAGMSKGGIAHYFASRDALFADAFEVFFDRIFERSAETMAQHHGAVAKLMSFTWLYDWEDPAVNVGYPLMLECMALAVRDQKYRELFRNWTDNWVRLLTEAVRDGMREGLFASDDAEATARAISAIYHGIAIRWYLDPENHSTAWAQQAVTSAIAALLGVAAEPLEESTKP